jgi:integrase
MGRRRVANVRLPKGVERVRARGRTYYYWNPGRGTDREGDRVSLPNADTHPADFWREVARRKSEISTNYPIGSVGDLVGQYRASEDFKALSKSTQSSYGVHLNRFAAPEAWGHLRVRDLTAAGVLAARDAIKDTPGMANHMLSCGRTLWNWAIPLDLADQNPFEKVKDLTVPDRGHIPWPQWGIAYVAEHAPPDLVRLERLGLMTCQRESDLIRMGPEHREKNGVWCRPKKTKRKRRTTFIPLQTADVIELDRWAETPITFTAMRWKKPIEQHRTDLYLYSPRGDPYTETSVRARWNRWLRRTLEGRELCRRWQEWVTAQVRKYEWEIAADDANNPTIHGLRGAGILIRFALGYEIDQIANDIGMSRQMVEHYMRFKDQMEVAAGGSARLKIVSDRREG